MKESILAIDMNILISGICGALGSKLALEMISLGHTVTGLKRSSSSIERIAEFETSLKLINIDSKASMLELEKQRIDTFFHTLTNYGRSGESFEETFNVNVQLAMKLLKISSGIGVRSFINCDTSLNRYHNNYSFTKAIFVDTGSKFAKGNSINFINAKLGTFFGDMKNTKQFTTNIIKQCLKNTKKIDLTHGKQKRDFIHIDDVVSALIFMIKYENKKKLNQIYISGGELLSIKDFSEQVLKITGAKSKLNFGAIASTEDCSLTLDTGGIDLRKFGWKASFSIEEAIKKTISDYMDKN